MVIILITNFNIVIKKMLLYASLLTFVVWLVSEVDAMRCSSHNESLCSGNDVGCDSYVECDPPEENKRAHCYVLWQNDTSGFQILQKGCWLNDVSCYNKSTCIETRKDGKRNRQGKQNIFFCCCDGDMCNRAMYHNPVPVEESTLQIPNSFQKKPIEMNDDGNQVFSTLMYTLVPLVGLTIILIIVFWVYRRKKMSEFNEIPTIDPTPLPPPSPLLGLRPVQLIEIKARGRFGAVWKAQIMTEYVAVKVFPLQDKASWIVEKDIYKLPQMKHDNILHFIGAEKRGDNLQAEFWLITAFHDKGSLYDYLKANLVSWQDLCKIGESMGRGLMFLHEELAATKGEAFKPSVAHRDFKSKNVLLKADNTVCIADLGLAVVFYPGETLSDAHGQVGTRRYMAPEVLEGAINFQRDSFLRIDMYACGLVLWEILSRCSLQDGPVEEYRLPFEAEVGQHPTLEDMQDAVVQRKSRPKIQDLWLKNSLLTVICDTIEECWDHDAEARLSASCIVERISMLSKTIPVVKSMSNRSNTGSRNSA